MKKYLLFVVALFSLFVVNTKAETFNNLNFIRWTLTNNSGTTLNSGQTPFYTNFMGYEYPEARLYFHYTNYTFYSDYYYDITYSYYFENHTNMGEYDFGSFVTSCYIYIEGIGDSNQHSDGCEFVEKDSTHVKIRTRNLKISGSGPVTLQLSSNFPTGNSDRIHVQMNSYELEINAKTDNSISSSQFDNAINDVKGKQDQTNSKLDDLNKNQNKTNQELKDTKDFLTDNTEADVDVSSLATVTGILPVGPVDSLLNIPFKFLSVLSSSVSGKCTPVTMSWVFSSSLTLPCFSEQFYDDVPPVIMTFLSIVPCAFILITYFKHLYKKVDRAVSMNTTADDEWGVI